ncbi:5'-3' exonuclease H3TH domain-containing protein [Aestuariirhabdus sp. LZHN29]|uniref:5'-3' exonuclease H3TH domain-containing protein n=1 Tax=Aestuariirhabdus sp. LZHN29 TaxID=3417462 RepID=UPI003CEB401C
MYTAETPEIKLLLVDGLNLVRRIHGAQQSVDKLDVRLLASLRRAIREAQASHLLMVMDGAGPSWRHQLYGGYKQGRKPMPADLQQYLPLLLQRLAVEGVALVEQPAVEADDVIAAVVARLVHKPLGIRILSTDKGFLPLLSDQVEIRDHFRPFDWCPQAVRERFGVGPLQLRDLWSLSGDSSNHIPGVSGIGPKRATELLGHYGSLHNVLAAAASIEGKVGQQLHAQRQQALLYRQLLEPNLNLPSVGNLKALRVDGRLRAQTG